MNLILKSFFFDQTGCQCPANGRMVLYRWGYDTDTNFGYVRNVTLTLEMSGREKPLGYKEH